MSSSCAYGVVTQQLPVGIVDAVWRLTVQLLLWCQLCQVLWSVTCQLAVIAGASVGGFCKPGRCIWSYTCVPD